MILEFQKRIAHLSRQILEAEAAGRGSDAETQKLRGALEEADHLFAFFKKNKEIEGQTYREDQKQGGTS